jgi:DNA polymerase-1
MAKILIADGTWFLHRAFHAGAQHSKDPPKRIAATVLTWFCSYSLRLGCTGGAFCLDGNQLERKKEFKGYKANREKTPGVGGESSSDDIIYASIPYIHETFGSLGLAVVRDPTAEADDLLRSAAYTLEKQGHEVILVAKDKDIRQSITGKVKVFVPEMGSGTKQRPSELWTVDYCVKQTGFTPIQYLDYQVLIGDSMDNVPEILGKSAAKKLLLEHGSLKEYFRTRRGRAFLEDNYEALIRNRKLVTLRKDAWAWGPCLFSLTKDYPNESYTQLKNRLSKRSLF